MPESRKDLVALVARLVLNTALGGPVAGVQVAGEAVIERLARGRPDAGAHRAALDAVTSGLREWADAEAIAGPDFEAGMTAAAAALQANGPTAQRIVELGMDSGRVSAAVLTGSRNYLSDLSEAAEQVCRRTVSEAYRLLLSEPNRLPELDRAFQRAVLRALREPAASRPESTAHPVLSLPGHRWSNERYSPSALLRATYQVVDFEGRQDELADLRAWCAASDRLAVRLYTGDGGMGKTRLMMELCQQVRGEGWRAGFLNAPASALAPAWVSDLTSGLISTLVVIDYAETKRQETTDLLAAAIEGGGGRLRCVLLARAATDWWWQLKRTSGPVGDLLNGPVTTAHRLAPLATDPADRIGVVRRAFDRFSSVLRTHHGQPHGPFADAHFDGVLFLHLAALSAAWDEGQERGRRDLLDAALRREQAFWDAGVRAMGLGTLAGRPITQAAAAATYAGQAGSRAEAVELIGQCPLLAGQSPAVLDAVAELLHGLYPGPAWLQGVQPDLLGEHLVGQVLADNPWLIDLL